MPNLKKVGILSLAVLIAQLILTKGLYPLIGVKTQTMFSISPATGVGGTKVGDTVLGYLSGYLPFQIADVGVLLAMYIGTFALVFAGFWLYEQKYVKLWKGKNLTQRLFAILLYGHAVLYVVLLALKWGVPGIGVNLLIGLVINLLLVSALVTISAAKLKFPRV
jgi:hypothetical protein